MLKEIFLTKVFLNIQSQSFKYCPSQVELENLKAKDLVCRPTELNPFAPLPTLPSSPGGR